jgi:phosphatidylglycerophosphatase C
MSRPRPTIVFDFDHTLTSWDTAERFFRWLLRRSPLRTGLVVVSLPILAPLLLSRWTRKIPIRFAVWLATLGRSLEDVRVLVEQHVLEIVGSQQRLILKDAANRLEQHLEQGHEVVVATGSLEVLARAYLDNSGLAHVPLVGSSLRPLFWGMVSREHCYGVRKIPMLTERGFPPPWATTYTDHQSDLPVIGHSAECFLVNPKPKAVRVITKKLSVSPKVLAWQ